ncbi:unannotated protein [freshwater metagenome]|uniref:Unannotated protein n=1 Tax=freshwater metagenome TaxID=449393 RepID=A0A6J6P7F8_9ZZZZ
MGTFTQNTELHEKCCNNKPPVMGPSATPMPENPAQIAIARPRSFGSRNTSVRIDNVEGMINAPPIPMNARVTMSCDADVANAENTEPAMNNTIPACSAPLRPNRSLRLPVVSSRPANTNVYESMIHCTWLFEACRSLMSEGIATLRMVLSITMMVMLRISTPSTHQRRSW